MAKMAKDTYKIHPAYASKDHFPTVLPWNKKVVNLTGKTRVNRPGSDLIPAYVEEIPGATQEDLAKLYKLQEEGKIVFRQEANIKVIVKSEQSKPDPSIAHPVTSVKAKD